MENQRPKVLISACLLGQKVRYDGGHTNHPYLTEAMKEMIDFVPVCPEVACGLGVPRKAIKLVHKNGRTLIRDEELTDQMESVFEKEYRSILKEMDGAILMKNSPSCGISNAKIYHPNGVSLRKGDGIFAQQIKDEFTSLPLEDSGRLYNKEILEEFFIRVFTLHRFKQLPKEVSSLQKFHAEHKYLFMSYDQSTLKQLGRIAAKKAINIEGIFSDYCELMLLLMKKGRSIGNKINSFTHMMGYFKNEMTGNEKAFIYEKVEEFSKGKGSFKNLLNLLSFFGKSNPKVYIENQILFNPIPESFY